MKHGHHILTAVAVGCFTTAAFGQSIVNSKHDLRGSATGGGQKLGLLTEVCLPCHAPHNPVPGGTDAPLWNHTLSVETFTMYTTLTGRTGNMNGPSKLCLSCHDGVTAMDAYGGALGDPINNKMTNPDTVVGSDLSNDHPIGLTYPTSGDYVAVATVEATLPLFDVGAETNRIECGSCHNAHDNTNNAFLRVSNTDSALCLTCHIK